MKQIESEISETKVYESLNDLIEVGKTPDENATYILLYEHKHFISILSNKTEIFDGIKAYVSSDEIKKYLFNKNEITPCIEVDGGYIDYDVYLARVAEISKMNYPVSKDGAIAKEPNYNIVYHITPKGTEIINVRVHYDAQSRWSGYDFTIKETGFKSHTNYAWMIAENTEENHKNISAYNVKNNELADLENTVKGLGKKIKTLQIKA